VWKLRAFFSKAVNMSTNGSDDEDQSSISEDDAINVAAFGPFGTFLGDGMQFGSGGAEFSNSSFSSALLNFNPWRSHGADLVDTAFDVDNVDPNSVYVGDEDYAVLQSMPELQREFVIGERMEALRDEALMYKATGERPEQEEDQAMVWGRSSHDEDIGSEEGVSQELPASSSVVNDIAEHAEELQHSGDMGNQPETAQAHVGVSTDGEGASTAALAEVVSGRGRGRGRGRPPTRNKSKSGRGRGRPPGSKGGRGCGRNKNSEGSRNAERREESTVERGEDGRGRIGATRAGAASIILGRGRGRRSGRTTQLPPRPVALQVQTDWEVKETLDEDGLGANFGNQQDVVDFFLGHRCKSYEEGIQHNLTTKLALHSMECTELNLFHVLIYSAFDTLVEYTNEALNDRNLLPLMYGEFRSFLGTLFLSSVFNTSADQAWELMSSCTSNKIMPRERFVQVLTNLRGYDIRRRIIANPSAQWIDQRNKLDHLHRLEKKFLKGQLNFFLTALLVVKWWMMKWKVPRPKMWK